MSAVPKLATPLDEDSLAAVLRDGHTHVFGAPPPLPRLRCAWAQNALEHASGKAIWNGNLGNITVPATSTGDFYVIPCKERTSRNPDVWELKQMRFAAHPDALEGAWAYWSLLAKGYASVLALFDADDAAGAAQRLGALHYFTADATAYAQGMAALARHFTAHVLPDLIGVAHDPAVLPVTVHLDCSGALDAGCREAAA